MTESVTRLALSLADRYRIECELGAGGMATVYLTEDIRHHRKVAIKVLHAELSTILGPERFLKEIELTANLQHPHILSLFDSGSSRLASERQVRQRFRAVWIGCSCRDPAERCGSPLLHRCCVN